MWLPFRRAPSAPQAPDRTAVLRWRDMPSQYPVRDLATLIATGLVVFICTGYLGYLHQSGIIRQLFQPPTVMYLWVCSILLLILARHPSARGRAVGPAIAFITSVFLVALFYIDRTYNSGSLTQKLVQLVQQILPTLTGGRFLFNLLNFGILLWYAVTVSLSWWRRYGPGARQVSEPRPDSGNASPAGLSTWQDLRNALHGELVSGDLLAGAAIAGFFALLFSPPVFGLLQTLAPHAVEGSASGVASIHGTTPPAHSAPPPCAITLPIYPCPFIPAHRPIPSILRPTLP